MGQAKESLAMSEPPATAIVGALAVLPAPISTRGVCSLCGAVFTAAAATERWVGHHAERCPWQMARQRMGSLAATLAAAQPRPEETSLSMAFRGLVACIVLSHRGLDDGQLLATLFSLQDIAERFGLEVQMIRQIQKAARTVPQLAARLKEWLVDSEAIAATPREPNGT